MAGNRKNTASARARAAEKEAPEITAREREDEELESEQAEIVWVRSKMKGDKAGGHPVALWEVDDAHPIPEGGTQGEAYVAGPKAVEVALTPQVMLLIRDGVLEEVDGPDEDEPPQQPRRFGNRAGEKGDKAAVGEANKPE